MRPGAFIAVVGPSGAGKDTLTDLAMAVRPDLVRARRVITRPPSPGTEDFDSVNDVEFDRMMTKGDLALHWKAHGLRYGIPASVDEDLAAGRSVVANLSRRSLPDAAQRFHDLHVLWITAPVEVLAKRLAARGREDEADIEARLRRKTDAPPPEAVIIDNGGDLNTACAAFLAALPAQAVSA
jgi:ribose 1,5-bisphosphokinase